MDDEVVDSMDAFEREQAYYEVLAQFSKKIKVHN